MGFEITDKNLKRAGLDYWQHLQWRKFPNIPTWQTSLLDPKRVFYFSAMATKSLYEIAYQKGDTFVFGRESVGLPEDLMQQNPSNCLLIPILGPVRGYNVGAAVAMVLSEAYRQIR
jgi:tRNA (cytidine/uridine-2'-O-)-methyltransferase